MKLKAMAGCAILLGTAVTTASFAQPAKTKAETDAAANTATSPDVNLTPRRIVFSPSDRGVKEITVFNRSNKGATYTIEVVDRMMTPDGELVAPERSPAEQKSRLKSATSWIRFSPRQVVLGPNDSQTVRVQARRPADLAAGEYRTHFSVTAVPPQDTGLDIASAANGASSELQIRLTPVYGIMIPIIVRQGEVAAQGGISNVRLLEQGGRRALQFTLTRSGGSSLYGAVDAFALDGGKPQPVAGIKGVGVYNEIDGRRMTLPLSAAGAGLHSGSKVRLVFTDDDVKPGAVLASTDVTLP